MTIKTVGVLGCGLMGAGHRASVCRGRIQDDRARGRGTASAKGISNREIPGRSVEKGMSPRRRDETSAPVRHDEGRRSCRVDLVIEAIVENIDEKAKTYAALEAVARRRRHHLSNTSFALHYRAGLENEAPRRFAAALLQPGADQKLVEVVRAFDDRQTYRAVLRVRPVAWQEAITRPRQSGIHRPTGCSCHICWTPSVVRALARHHRGHRQGHEARCGYPMGPFTLLDFVGLDNDLLHRQHHVRRVSRAGVTPRRRC